MNQADSAIASIEAEHSVIGALILQPDAIERIDWLRPEHFFRLAHRNIFKAQLRLIESRKGCDIVLLSDALRFAGELESSGGLSYLATLAQNTPSAWNIAHYAGIVRDKAILRALAAGCAEIGDRARSPQAKPHELAQEAETAFLAILEPEAGESISIMEAVDQALEWMESPQRGLSTGMLNLDRIIEGLRPEELIIIAGRPGMGKSSLAQCITESVARDAPVLFCTLEMSARQVAKRSITYHSERLGSEAAAVTHMATLKLRIDPRAPLPLSALRMRARRHKRKHGLSLLVVDYLQLIEGPKSDNRNQEVGAISRGLKGLAKELGIPVIAVASLNRQVENRQDRRPVMSDLKESGDIESDADIVIMVYRDQEYNPGSEWGQISEAIVRKHREGSTGTAYLRWDGKTTRFHDYSGDLPAQSAPARSGKISNFSDYKSRAGYGDES